MRLDPEAVAALVVSLLSEELRWQKWRGHPNPVAGHCYTASEVCRALLGAVWRPYMVRQEGSYHWFLVHGESGEILDPTASQFIQLPPYERARPARFGNRYSAAAEILIWRVVESLGAAAPLEQ